MFQNQNVRSTPSKERPTGLYDDIVNLHNIIVISAVPTVDIGKDGDYVIDNTSGDLYGPKSSGSWEAPIYNFAGGTGGTLSNLANIGSGEQIFKGLNGTIAELRTITTTTDEIDAMQLADEVLLSMSEDYVPQTLNRVVNVKCEYGASVPPTVENDDSQGYSDGSTWTTLDGQLFICTDATDGAAIWVDVGTNTGIADIINGGSGAGILNDITFGTATLNSIGSRANEIDVIQFPESRLIRLDMSSAYVPESLDLVTNIKDNRSGVQSQPTIDSDSTEGYTKGSIWVEQEIGGLNKMWICNSAAPAAAVWQLYPPAGSGGSNKDFVQFSIGATVGYTQAITGVFQDFNFGPDTPSINAIALASSWSTLFDATRQVFRRAPTTAGRSYICSVSIIIQSFAPTGTENDYTLIMTRKQDSVLYPQSRTNAAFPASSVVTKTRTITTTFIFYEPLSTQQDYFFRVQGTQVGGGAGVNFNVNSWAVSFKEI